MSYLPGKSKSTQSQRNGKQAEEYESPDESVDYVETVLAEYDQDLPEERQIDETLHRGIELANTGKWEEAAICFRESMAEQYDYDIPHLWLADYLKQTKGAFSAIDSLKGAAKICRRKSYLLGKAAEMGLLEMGWTSDFLELFSQAIAALPNRPRPRDFGKQRLFLFFREICDAAGDDDGVAWTLRIVTETGLNEEMLSRIYHQYHSDPNYANSTYIAFKVQRFREALEKRFPA
jgi:tetratricopeptide (TPR) repeat protein